MDEYFADRPAINPVGEGAYKQQTDSKRVLADGALSRRPKAEDFGLTERDERRVSKLIELASKGCIPLTVLLLYLTYFPIRVVLDFVNAVICLYVLFFVFLSASALIVAAISKSLPITRKARAYRSAVEVFEKREAEKLRLKKDFWLQLNGYQFEKELTTLFNKHGFVARATPGSGDGGVDIILTDNDKE